jgi:hypothetical protein
MPDHDFEKSFDYRCVAFLDILGFSALVEADAEAPLPIHLPRILTCLELVQETIDGDIDLDIQTFSDSIIITSAFDPESFCLLLDLVVAMERTFIENALCLRGGVAFGRHYDDGRVLYSGGLVSAYRIESRQAKVPRVVVDRNLLDLMLNRPDIESDHRDRIHATLLQDKDGQAFVNYLDEGILVPHRTVVADIGGASLRSGDPSLLEKYLWLVEYHNHMCDGAGFPEHVVEEPGTSFSPL